MSEERDQPVAEEPIVDTSEAGVADEAQAQGEDEPQLDGDGNPIEGDAEDDQEEIEHDGAKYKLPKALAKEFREGTLRQGDYTRKTQELGTQRQELATRSAELAQQAEAQATTLEERATLKALDAQLKQFNDLDWRAYTEQFGSEAAITAQGQWQQLQQAKAGLETEITRKEAEHRSKSEQATATARGEAVQKLQAEIGLTQELDVAITQTAASYGFAPAEIAATLVDADGKPDVRAYKVLAELHQLREFKAKHEAKTTTAQAAQKVAAVQPAKTVGQRSSGYKPGLDDSLPPAEWLRRRNAEVAKAGRR